MLTNKTLRFVSVVAGSALCGLVTIQVFWVQKAYRFTSEQFQNRVELGLLNVANQVYRYHSDSTNIRESVVTTDGDLFAMQIGATTSPDFLLNLLVAEFRKQSILQDFQVGMYDCFADSVVWRQYSEALGPLFHASGTNNIPWTKQLSDLNLSKDSHTVLVHFTKQGAFISRQMSLMYFTTLGILIIMGVFIFMVFIIFREKRLSAMRQDFINNMTHEFKTPIASLLVAGEVLQKDRTASAPEKVKSYGSIIQKESLRLRNQVEQILKVALIESNRHKLKMEPLDLGLLVQEIVAQIKLRMDASGAKFTAEIDSEHPYLIMGHATHLGNALYNLLDNALKYGGDEVEIFLSLKRTGPHQVSLTVQDNGPGIPQKLQRMVFEKFYRVPTGNLHDVKGFGLGLSYVKQIAKHHHALIQLESAPGKGATFTLTFNSIKP